MGTLTCSPFAESCTCIKENLLKKALFVFTLLSLFSFNSFAIGSQHGIFRSQSTQGTPWQGTAQITSEVFNITVMPDYLDVELEWEFTVGGTAPQEHADALEIVGNLNLEANSVVVGMITWYKGMTLKGKLKTQEVAREQYETVVQRDADRPPPPRDPVLLEYSWGEDNYDISIFPVSFGGTRKVRIRYLIPAFNREGENKIAFPNAFTDIAQVNVQPGPGVEGYTIESCVDRKLFTKTASHPLDSREFSFQAWGGHSGAKRIAFIIPVLENSRARGSTMYSGTFSTPHMSGEMLHVVTITPEKALLESNITEDFVILWRWNHPEILSRYARQIVEQSKLLVQFLESLKSAHKKAALVISKKGEEPITFTLDKKSGPEFKRMLQYLGQLSSQSIIDPPMSTSRNTIDLQYDPGEALKEFENALQLAMTLFDQRSASLKHLLVLTAGPQLVAPTYSYASQSVSWDSTISVGLLTRYLDTKPTISSQIDNLYWPGVDISSFTSSYRGKWSVTATVGNGTDTFRIDVLAPPSENCPHCPYTQTTDMHLFSRPSLQKSIRWNISSNGTELITFTESPRVVLMADGLQYARLIGASKHLVPLADVMPSSIASTLGFIDSTYSLVALEEDALPADLAMHYKNQGVPLLEQDDLFPGANERADVPVHEWLITHPPVPISTKVHSNTIVMWDIKTRANAFDGVVLNIFRPAIVDALTPADQNLAIRNVVPMVNPIYASSQDPQSYPDYHEVLDAKPEEIQNRSRSSFLAYVRGTTLILNLKGLGADRDKPLLITLFDISGRAVYSWKRTTPLSQGIVSLACKNLARGTYLVNIKCGKMNLKRHVIVH